MEMFYFDKNDLIIIFVKVKYFFKTINFEFYNKNIKKVKVLHQPDKLNLLWYDSNILLTIDKYIPKDIKFLINKIY